MKRQNMNLSRLFFILLYIGAYYGWIFYWQDNDVLLTWGGNIFSIVGSLIAAFWLFIPFRRGSKTERLFWLLLSLGSFSYLLAEAIWLFQENILKNEITFPSYSDFFYHLQVLFFLAAFIYRFAKERKTYDTARHIFDILIVMTVATTFSWHFFMNPIWSNSSMSNLSYMVTLMYPIGDLALLFSAMSLYFAVKNSFSANEINLILSGILIRILADTLFLYLSYNDRYFSGNFIDPLFILSLLIFSYTGTLHQEKSEQPSTNTEQYQLQKLELIRLIIPYLNVSVLLVFMSIRSKGLDEFTLGATLSVLLMMARQVLMMIENKNILYQYHMKTKELEISEERYKSLFEYNPDPVFSLDREGKFVSVNSACEQLIGIEKKELVGVYSTDFTTESNREKASKRFSQVMKGIPQTYEIPIFDKSGKVHHASITNIPIMVRNQLVGIFGVGKDITELKKKEEKIQYLAYHDSLTGLSNRVAFAEMLNQAVSDAKRTNEMFAMMFMDLDRFKIINDTLGHDVGDQLLISVTDRMKGCLGKNDTAARLGGDEFTFIIKDIFSPKDAESVAQRILKAFDQPFIINGHEISTSPSIGIVIYPLNDQSPVALMKKADIAMYLVKENGKGNFKLFDESDLGLIKKVSLEEDIQQALSDNQFFLHYQPQINTKTNEIVGVEALIRWNHPKFGVILPNEFIPIAEKTGMIIPIGEWVLRDACQQARIWNEMGYPLKLAVNLSPQQFHQENLVGRINKIIQETRISPDKIDLEITEAIAMEDIKKLMPKLMSLKKLGVNLSVDDFGTGYSSLSYLSTFPINSLKLARGFISKIEDNPINQTVITSVLNMAQKLNIHVIAEGVETESQAAFLRENHCHELQGFLFGKPVAPEEIEKQLAINQQFNRI
jgi:diguanylate cyclase (GGDEF)-like protein/PAS domain S-box-containing protein